MKKRLIKIIVFIILIMPCYVYAEDISYDNAQKIVKESMQAWYMRGSYLQYNSSKKSYYKIVHPEESTSQDMGYTVCSGYTNLVYQEAFGMMAEDKGKYSGTRIPTSSTTYVLHTEDYIKNHNCQTGVSSTGCNGEYAIYYEKNTDNTTYFYNISNTNENPTFEEFIQNIKPGDVFAYDGHAWIAYDVAINPKTNKLDVLLLQTGGSHEVMTKIDPDNNSTNRLCYNNAKSNNNDNGLISLDVAGSQMTNQGTLSNKAWLSEFGRSSTKDAHFVDSYGRIKCRSDHDMCSISRFFYKDSNNKAKFNYEVNDQQIKNSMLRTKLPGIFIHKTADSLDNNSVYPDQTVTYTIKIANQSNVNLKDGGKNYSKFYVSEVIPTDKVDFISATNSGVYSNGKITWTINSLNAGQNITLTYTVKVKNTDELIDKKIDAEGTVYIDNTGSITTGVVSNEVIRKPATKKDTYQNCYNKYKDSKKELELIDEVYKCAYGVDLKLNKFSLDGEDNNMFSKLITHEKDNSKRTGKITIVNNDVTKNYYDMILNDYWNMTAPGKVVQNDDGTYYNIYYLPGWYNTYRADTIYKEHFKDGDVLIYYNVNDIIYNHADPKKNLELTKEQGIYAYIYLDGKFVGQNQTGDAVRNEFTYEYYPEETRGEKLINNIYNNAEELTFVNYQTLFGKDYYVILRPEKIIQSNNVDIVVPNTGKNTSIIFTIVGGLIIVIGSLVLITKRRRVN